MVADGFEPRFGGLEVRVAVLEQIAADTRSVLERLDWRLDRMAGRQDADFRWLLGVVLAGLAGMLGAMAHGFHWL